MSKWVRNLNRSKLLWLVFLNQKFFRIRPKQLKFGYFYFNTCLQKRTYQIFSFSLKLFDLDWFFLQPNSPTREMSGSPRRFANQGLVYLKEIQTLEEVQELSVKQAKDILAMNRVNFKGILVNFFKTFFSWNCTNNIFNDFLIQN